MINGVLVERTVQDVIPALRTNAEGLKKVLDDLVKQYKIKQDDLEKWKVGRLPELGLRVSWPHSISVVELLTYMTVYTEEEQCPGCPVVTRHWRYGR